VSLVTVTLFSFLLVYFQFFSSLSHPLNSALHCAVHLLRAHEGPVYNPGPDIVKKCYSYPQSLQINAAVLPDIRPQLRPITSYLICYLSVVLTFNAADLNPCHHC
jgi:hypothetical protein